MEIIIPQQTDIAATGDQQAPVLNFVEQASSAESAPVNLGPTPAMLEAAPQHSLHQSRAYMVGALAAAHRRANPIVAPTAFCELVKTPVVDTDEVATAELLPLAASPLVELIRKKLPDVVIGADRGGRMIGVAIHQVWQQRYPGVPFPTIDGKIHFGRISKTPDFCNTRDVVAHILNRSGVMAEMAQRKAEGDERPAKVLLLDDWATSGTTVERGVKLLREHLNGGHNLQFMLGTMGGGQCRIQPHTIGLDGVWGATWCDESDAIGVRYTYRQGVVDRDADGWDGAFGIWPLATKTSEARQLRQEIAGHVRNQIVPSPHRYPPKTADTKANRPQYPLEMF